MALVLVTAPTVEPVTVAEAKTFSRIDSSDEDLLILELIKSARRWAETFLRRQLLPATWKLVLENFDDEIRFPLSPVTSVSSITYYDPNNNLTTLASTDYELDSNSEPAVLRPVWNYYWPSTYARFGAVNVIFISGYANAAAVPETIKTAIKVLVSNWFENRESIGSVPPVVEQLLWTERVFEFV